MSFSYGRSSQAVLVTVHPDLEIIAMHVIEVFDIRLLQGARTIEEQIWNIRRGVSKTLNSRHIPRDEEGRYDPNQPAIALDFAPYKFGVNPWPVDSDSRATREKKKGRWYYAQGIIRQVAHEHGIEIRQGVDWDMDGNFFDQSFDDLGHVELVQLDWPPLIVEGELLERANAALRSRGLPEWRNAA